MAGIVGADATRSARGGSAREAVGSDWMITRHGRSASTVSTVLPNTRARRCAAAAAARSPGAHLAASSTIIAPGAARAHLLDVAGHAPAALQPRLLDDRLGAASSASGSAASIGADCGTAM